MSKCVDTGCWEQHLILYIKQICTLTHNFDDNSYLKIDFMYYHENHEDRPLSQWEAFGKFYPGTRASKWLSLVLND